MKKLFFLFCLTFSALNVFAADGDLDASFGSGGVVNEPFRGVSAMHNSVVVQPDGKILVAGQDFVNATTFNDFALVRYNSNGSVDTSFGTNGKVYVPRAGQDVFPNLMLRPDGKIVFVGLAKDAQDRNIFSIYQFNPNGAPDTAFGTNGFTDSNFPDGTSGNDAVLQPDGKIVVTGSWRGTAFCVARYNQNGSLDTTFGAGGDFCASTSPLGTGLMNSVALQPDGKILVAGKFLTSFTVPSNFIVFRFTPTGTLDTSFDGDGYAITDFNNGYDDALSIHVLSDGKILAIGRAGVSASNPQYNFGLARYNQNGSLDAAFGSNGKATAFPDNTSGAEIYSAVVLNNVKIVVGRSRVQPSPGISTEAQIARFNANGSVDTSFGANGQVINSQMRWLRDVARQTDGKILAVGVNQNGLGITARYLNTDSAPVVNNPALRIADFDGDGKTDASVFRNGTWFINPSGNPTAFAPQGFYGVQFGTATDKLTPADFDGDGKTDLAVWRSDPARAYFYILNSSNNTVRAEQFGREGDLPFVAGDWDGDGRADPAVFRDGAQNGGQSAFFYRPSSQTGVDFTAINWGAPGDKPLRGDFDGDGKFDAAVFRPSAGLWLIRQSSNGNLRAENWGVGTDKFVPADYDGDGKTDLAVFRSGTWYIKQSSNNSSLYRNWGLDGDALAPGDYDGDGCADAAIWRNGVFYILNSSNNQAVYQNFGSANDIPVAAFTAQ